MVLKRKIRRPRKLKAFICILKGRHTEYVEIVTKNLVMANTIAEKKYPNDVDFVYLAQRHSGSCLTKIETLIDDIISPTGDHNIN